MRIAILGANGVFGRYLTTALNATPITRTTFDMLDGDAMRSYFRANAFDVVVNAAVHSNSDMTTFNPGVLADNLRMFANLYDARDTFGRLISFGSGAEFDRRGDITNAKEERIYERMPADHYGLSKNVNARISAMTDNFYTLRIFGAFYPGEAPTRLLPKILSGQTVSIKDRYLDYIYLEDLLPVVQYFSKGEPMCSDINVVYADKMLLSNFTQLFCKVNNLSNTNIQIDGMAKFNYTGDGTKLQSLDLPQMGIVTGFKKYK